MEQNDLNYSGQYLDDKYFKIKIATGGDIYNAAGNAVAGEMFLVTGTQPALYAAKSTSAFNEGIVDHEIYKVKDLNDTVKIKNAGLMNFPGSTNASNRYGLSFNGVDDYMDTNLTFESLIRKGKISISFWAKAEKLDGSTEVFFGADNSTGSRIKVFLASNKITSFMEANGDGGSDTLVDNSGTDYSKWFHVAVTYEEINGGIDNKLYINGSLVDSGTAASVSMNDYGDGGITPNAFIGAQTASGTLAFSGLIDEVAVFDRILSEAEASSIYNNTDLSTYSPASWWRMEEGSGTSVANQGSEGGSATIDGATFYPREVKSSVYSLELDGSTSASLASDISFSGPFTISAWIKPKTATQFSNPLGDASGSNFNLRFWNGALTFLYDNSNSVAVGNIYDNDLWYHVVIVRDSSDLITAYMNGVTGSPATHQKNYSGTITTNKLIGSTNPFIGFCDEYAIWDTDQSSNIAEIYNGGIPTNLDPLAPIGWWRMGDDDSGSGTTITDQGSGANDATIVGNATYSAQTPE